MSTSTVTNNSDSQAIWAGLNGTKSSSSSGNSTIADTQNQFLKLLTTQLKNQDPLNPMDNAQMTSQLAQISTVEGISKLNSTLQTMLSSSNDSQAMQAASLVGRGVLVPGNSVVMTDGKAFAGYELAGAADKVTVTVKDSNGLVVRKLDLGSATAGLNAFSWDGKTDNGSAAANGTYTFTVAAVQGGSSVKSTSLSVGLVDSVARKGTDISLNVGSLGTFGFSDVREVL